MRYYGFNDYGLILDSDDMERIASQICEDYTEEAFTDVPWAFCEIVSDKLGIDYVGAFCGEASVIDDRGFDGWSGVYGYADDTVYYLPLNRSPGLFNRAYESFDDIVLEMKGRVGSYLPKDFNYRDNIRHIVGTYYG